MSTSSSSASGGIGIGGLTFVILLVLKIMGQITLGWFWVISSIIWAPVLAVLVIFGVIAIIGAITVGGVAAVSAIESSSKKRIGKR